MSNFCKICGEEKVNNVCPNAGLHIKKMCLNCNSICSENDNFFCNNQENMQDAVDSLLKNLPDSYSIKSLELKPNPIKAPTKKCKRWALNKEVILEEINNL